MTIAFATPPDSAAEMAAAAMSGRGLVELRRATSRESLLRSPHAVYNMGLDDIVAGKGLPEGARQTGWRYLIGDSAYNVVAAAEVRTAADGTPQTFDHINTGPFVRATIEAIQVAEATSTANGTDYMLGILRIPALYVMSVLLQAADDRTHDLVIPLAPAPDFLSAGTVYTVADFIETLRAPAQARLQAFERLKHRDPPNPF